MDRLRDCSEIKEAAELLTVLLDAREASNKTSREERLRTCLKDTCRRGRFRTAVVADAQGLPIVVHGSAVDSDAIAAVVTLLGDALERVAKVLDQPDANHLSVDVGFDDRVLVQRFSVEGRPFFLLLIAPLEGDPRAEVALSIEEIAAIMR